MFSIRASASRGVLACTVLDRAFVAGVHRLHHVEGFGATHLTDDDAVGAHTQGVAHQVALRHLALAFQAGRARLQAHDVALLQPQLRRVLDRDDALRVRNEATKAR